jgi:hypothetical protein
MAFKVKDLMITVLPPEGKNRGAAPAACPDCTLNISGCGYTCGCTNCTACSVTYTQGRSCFCLIARPEDLTILKEELKQALLNIEIKEREIEEAMRPKTLSEVEELEEKLTAALAEIKAQKAKLRKAAPDKK